MTETGLDQIRVARAYLMAVEDHSASTLRAIVAEVGPVAALTTGIPPGRALPRDTGERELTTAADAGIRLVIPEDDEWPRAALAGLADTGLPGPIGLWVRGADLTELTGRAVTVTGSRAATVYGQLVATGLGFGLAEADVTTVTGGGLGVDAAACRGVLAAGGRGIAVLPTGLLRPHPASSGQQFDELVAWGGALVSECPLQARVSRDRIAARGRLMAALGCGVVIVEASERSHALGVAAASAVLPRPVLVVPGQVSSPLSAGCHQLIRDGHELVTGTSDVLTALKLAPGGPA